MIPLLDNRQDLGQCAVEIGSEVGQLLTPLTRYKLRDPTKPWAIDNGAYTEFREKNFLSLLEREQHHKENCLFVSVPDVVSSARRTLEIFHIWAPKLVGWKLALVCQDGQENLPIPWELISAVFIGGSTSWKVSIHVQQIVKAAKILGKHVHAGRVNDESRWRFFEDLGCDTADGTGISRYSHMRKKIAGRGDKDGFFLHREPQSRQKSEGLES